MTTALITLAILAGLVFMAALQQDLASRRIPNALPAALLVIGAVKWVLVGSPAEAEWAAGAAALVLVATSLMFWLGWMGGGDVKLMTGGSFMLGGPDTAGFIIMTSLIGGVVALIVLCYSFFARRGKAAPAGEADNAVAPTKPTVPYGVAISLAGLWILLKHWLR